MTLLKPSLRRNYPVAVSARGSHITTADGRRFFDGASGAIACTIGHCDRRVRAAIDDQLARIGFAYRTHFANEPAERLARRLCERLNYAAAFFVNSGSEAVETAVRIAQQVWRERGRPEKTRILSRRLGYHGATSGALALSGHWPRRRSAGPLSGEPTLPTPYCLRCPLGQSPTQCRLACADAVERQIAEIGAGTIAAVLIEPIVGASGAAIVPPAGYLRRLREICDRHDILLIADEVLTGIGRTGRWLAMEHGGVGADIVCLGKGLNAGYFPISGVLVSTPVLTALRDGSASFTLGHTHSNHPVAAAAANAVLDVIEEEKLVERAERIGASIGERLGGIAREHAIVADVRGAGMLWGLELVRDDVNQLPFDPRLGAAERVVEAAFALGLVVYPSAGFASSLGGDAVIFAPPLNACESDIADALTVLDRALSDAAGDLFRTTHASGSEEIDDAA